MRSALRVTNETQAAIKETDQESPAIFSFVLGPEKEVEGESGEHDEQTHDPDEYEKSEKRRQFWAHVMELEEEHEPRRAAVALPEQRLVVRVGRRARIFRHHHIPQPQINRCYLSSCDHICDQISINDTNKTQSLEGVDGNRLS